MLFTALNLQDSKRIEMDVLRLLMWEDPVLICFIRRRILGTIEDGKARGFFWDLRSPSPRTEDWHNELVALAVI